VAIRKEVICQRAARIARDFDIPSLTPNITLHSKVTSQQGKILHLTHMGEKSVLFCHNFFLNVFFSRRKKNVYKMIYK